jgi:hypothetical protein
MGAARRWAAYRPQTQTDDDGKGDELRDDLRAFGLDDHAIEEELARRGLAGTADDDEDFAVLPENELSLRVFLALGTQWRRDGMSGRVLGLNYQAAASVMDMLKVADREMVFEDVRAMELAALAVLNKD